MRFTQLDRMLPASLRAGDADARRRARVVAAFGLVLGALAAVLTLIALSCGLWANIPGTAFGGCVSGMLLWRLRRGTSVKLLGAAAGAMMLVVAGQGAIELGGFGAPPLNWLAVTPLLVLLVSGPRVGIAFAVVGAIGYTAFFLAPGRAAAVSPLLRYLDGVALAGFVVTLALTYETFKQRAVDEMREAQHRIEALQAQLLDSAHAAGMAEVATSVLHNVGNAMNHVTTAAALATQRVKGLRLDGMEQLALRLADPAGPDRERTIARYLDELAKDLRRSQSEATAELARVDDGLRRAAAMVASQQQHAGDSRLLAMVDLKQAVEAALGIEREAGLCDGLEVIAELGAIPPCHTSRHKVLLVFSSLFRNAIHALREGGFARRLTVRLSRSTGDTVTLEVHDTGVGIAPEHAASVFRQGYTTRADGLGLGLHSATIAARELGGQLTFHSDGRGLGASFVLAIPFAPGELSAREARQRRA